MLSSYLANALADKILQNTNFTVTTPYISLHTASPGTTGTNELTAGSEGGSYARQSCGSWDTSLPRTNTSVVTWTNTPFAAITHFGIWDTVSGGNFLMGGELSVPLTLFLGETARFSAGRLLVNCEARFSTYLKPKVLDKILKNTDFTVTAAYMSIHTADPGTTGTGEVSGSGTRPNISSGGTFGAPSLSSNTWTVEWTSVSGSGWDLLADNTYGYVGLWDASSAGNFLMGGAIVSYSIVSTTGGGSTVVLDVGDKALFKFTQVP